MFAIVGVYNSQNDRIWAANYDEADAKGGIKQIQEFPQKVMVWLGICSKWISPLVIFEGGTVYHVRYIKEVLPVVLKFGNGIFGNDRMFQQDGAKPHTHKKTQDWYRDHFPGSIDKDHWPPNSPDLNLLHYCIWDKYARAINWDLVTSKKTLINQLECAVKKIPEQILFESCSSWTSRLYRLKGSHGNYLNK
ncbi:unnamed protein product [Adineta ricciae]|uniref:Transposase n=1 Tax=Adineta ricciae TaxID=249248 RepID=A0A815H578_ADIRI|nr:unnamed protein product [Adineta ricciae]CAF1679422.1 unnamed protein product [Adineta ricciae]